MWYINIASRFFGLVTKHACDRRTDGQNYDSQDRASIAASRGKKKFNFYSARNARIASAVLATAIPSVCLSVCLSVRPSVCPSVRHTPLLCQNGGTYSTVQFAPLDSKMCLVL